jgi:hypothetical protein
MLCKYIFTHTYPLGKGILFIPLFSQNQYTLMKHMCRRYVNLKNYTLFTTLDISNTTCTQSQICFDINFLKKIMN